MRSFLPPLWRFLNNRLFIAYCYVSIKLAQLIHSVLAYDEGAVLVAAQVVMVIIPLLLTVFTGKGSQIAARLMGLLLLVSGIGAVVVGVVVFPLAEYMLKTANIVLGLYFTYGGILLLAPEKKREGRDRAA